MMWQLLVVSLCGVQLVSAVTHSLRYFHTGFTGVPGFPEFVAVGMVDDEQIDYYDSVTQKDVPKQQWMKDHMDASYWERQTQKRFGWQQGSNKYALEELPKRFNQTDSKHSSHELSSCLRRGQGCPGQGWTGSCLVSAPGELCVTKQDVSALFTVACARQRAVTEDRAECSDLSLTHTQQDSSHLEIGSISLSPERPQVSVFHKDSRSGGTELTCLATGFFPRDILVSWLRDGQELQEDVDSGEVLPNGDGSFQVRKSLRVRAGEEDKYSCRVDHKSLSPGDILMPWGEFRGVGHRGKEVPIIAAVCAVVALAVIAVVAVVLVRRRKSSGGQKPIYRQAAGKEPGDSSSNSSA
uniref:Ig-like domain-containing protein n=1 Tax=Lepisosteus oculatus TaxID=7918 RepID=W5LVT1_LEPOC